MSGKKYKDKVEQRTKEEEKAMKAKVAAKKQDLMSELTTDVIRTYFDEDGVGDGKLFNRLHRDKIVGVIDSDDFLFWNGAHWEKAKEKQEFYPADKGYPSQSVCFSCFFIILFP